MQNSDEDRTWLRRQADAVSGWGTAKETSKNLNEAGKNLIDHAEKSAKHVADSSVEKIGEEITKQIIFAKENLDDSIIQLRKTIEGITPNIKRNILFPLATFGFIFLFFMVGILGFLLGKYGL